MDLMDFLKVTNLKLKTISTFNFIRSILAITPFIEAIIAIVTKQNGKWTKW
jgi:hypothetical protein